MNISVGIPKYANAIGHGNDLKSLCETPKNKF